MRVLRPLLVLAMPILVGCFLQKTQDNVVVDREVIKGIVVGKTTIGEAFELLGSPIRAIKLLEHEAYVFEHSVEKRSGLFALILITQRVERGSDAVTVIVDREGIVRAVGSRFSSERPRFGTPWGE